MQTVLFTFLILLFIVAAMAIGVIMGRGAIKGSCGGMTSIEGLESACDICSKPCAKKRKLLEQQES